MPLAQVIRHTHHLLNPLFGSQGGPTYEGLIMLGLEEEQLQTPILDQVPFTFDLVHIAIIEDRIVSELVAPEPQVPLIAQHNWATRINLPHTDILFGAGDEATQVAIGLNLQGLQSYRLAVAENTLQLVGKLEIEDLDIMVDGSRVDHAVANGILSQEVRTKEQGKQIVQFWKANTCLRMLFHVIANHPGTHLGRIDTLKGLAGIGILI